MKHCLKCGRDFSEAHRFCGGCGGLLSSTEDSTSTPHCPNCAVPLRAVWKFCGKCQTPLATLTGEPRPSFTPQPLILEPTPPPAAAPLHGGGSSAPFLDVPGMMRCPACHLMVDADGGDFYEHCGSTLPRGDGFHAAAPEPDPPAPSPALQETLPIQEIQLARESPPAHEAPPEYEARLVLTAAAFTSDETVDRDSTDDIRAEITAEPPKEIAPTVTATPERGRANDLDAPAALAATLSQPEEFVPSRGATRHEGLFEDSEDSAAPRPTLLNRWVLSGGVVFCLLLVGVIFLLKWGGGARQRLSRPLRPCQA